MRDGPEEAGMGSGGAMLDDCTARLVRALTRDDGGKSAVGDNLSVDSRMRGVGGTGERDGRGEVAESVGRRLRSSNELSDCRVCCVFSSDRSELHGKRRGGNDVGDNASAEAVELLAAEGEKDKALSAGFVKLLLRTPP